MSSRPRDLIMCFVVLPGLVACSAQVTSSEANTGEPTKLTAIVEIDRTVSDANDGSGHGSAIARFVRASDEGALRLVSATADFPAIGTCVIGSGGSAGSTQHPVELLDVGNVTIEGAGVRSTLVARRLPDVVDLVSGVVYTARGPEDGSFGAGHYVLRVAGSSDVPSFVREADGPSAPSLVRVDGNDISWEPGTDAILVEITGTTTTRCAFADTGHASLPQAAFGATGVLTIHRIHREPFVTAGVDRGEIRFDFARAIPYRR